MVIVEIQCPSCKNRGNIDVSEENLKNIKRGLLAINVSKKLCEHTFITYIDQNFIIRDYFIADYHFQVDLPDIELPEKSSDMNVPEQYLINSNLIKLNLSGNLIAYIFKSICLKKKILIISDDSFLNETILNFFKYITQDSFNVDISFVLDEQYKKTSKNFKDYIVFKGIDIIRNPGKIIKPKKLIIEKKIIQRFIDEPDLNKCLLILKNDIQKVYFFARAMLDLIKSQESNKKINILKVHTSLEKIYNIKISNLYLEFLVEIVRNYFTMDLPSIFESFHDLL